MESAEEKIGTSTNWKQSFNYDRFGNRTFDAANTTTISTSTTVTSPSASTATNRLNGYTYDAAGNLTVDAENRRFVYDAENHQTKLFGPANNPRHLRFSICDFRLPRDIGSSGISSFEV